MAERIVDALSRPIVVEGREYGKARIAVFDRSMEARGIQRMEIETEMRSALERGEFEVYYQPIYSLADQRITECEALVRWRKRDGRLVLRAHFIPIADETGLSSYLSGSGCSIGPASRRGAGRISIYLRVWLQILGQDRRAHF